MNPHARYASAACAVLLAAQAAAFAGEPKIEETIVGPVGEGGLYVLSQNDARVAYVGAKGTRTVVSVDGVEGPVLDELFNGSAAIISAGGSVLVHNANAGGKFNGTPTAVIFSESGSHYAYIGRQGNEYVVIHDGKEVGRSPRSALGLNYNPLGLSPKGNFAYWGELKIEASRGQYRLIVDGQANPWAGHQDLKPVFSPDDKHYAYTAGKAEDYKQPMLIIDGKVASYVGMNPQYTADSKSLLTLAPTGNNVVLLNGKPVVTAPISVEKIVPGPVGSRYAVIVRKGTINYEGVGALYLDGKLVPGTDGAMDITFSPDGKHYALRCKNAEARTFFMVIDGKAGTEYQGVAEKVSWSPDSTKAIYQISNSGRNFVVVNNTEEFGTGLVGSLTRDPIVFATTGSRYAFSSIDGSNRNFLTIVDGKNVLPAGFSPIGDTLDFSDDGSRYAMMMNVAGRNDSGGLLIDGTLNNDLSPGLFGGTNWMNPTRNLYFKWSSHGKYLARMGRRADNSGGLFINERLAYPTTLQVMYPTFTPDGEHLFWLATVRATDRPQLDYMVYSDGAEIVRLRGDPFQGIKGNWTVDAKGVFTFVAVVDDSVKRFRVTPDADTNVARMAEESEARQAKELAEAAAAKKKAAEAAAAAKAKAEEERLAAAAKAKADYEAAVAAKKKAAEAAAAAKAKARADAAAAKAKARADAAAAKARK